MNAWMRVAVALAAVVVGASAICGAENTPSAILIRNATILTVSHGTIEKGDVLIKDGKIAAVGTSVPAPADAQVLKQGASDHYPVRATIQPATQP